MDLILEKLFLIIKMNNYQTILKNDINIIIVINYIYLKKLSECLSLFLIFSSHFVIGNPA